MNRKNVLDMRFGFPVLLANVEVKDIFGEQVAIVNGKRLKYSVLAALVLKEGRITGNEARFLRLWMECGLSDFARKLGVTHAAVAKWENKGDQVTHMHKAGEMWLRLIVAKRLLGELASWGRQEKPVALLDFQERVPSEAVAMDVITELIYEKTLEQPLQLSP